MTAPRRGGTTTAPRGGGLLTIAAEPYGFRTAAAPRGPAQAVPRAPWAQAAACASEAIDSSRNAAPSVDRIVFIPVLALIGKGRVLRIVGVLVQVWHRADGLAAPQDGRTRTRRTRLKAVLLGRGGQGSGIHRAGSSPLPLCRAGSQGHILSSPLPALALAICVRVRPLSLRWP